MHKLLLLSLLAACPGPKDTAETGDSGDTDDTGDSGDTDDTGDTGTPAALPVDFPATLTEDGGCADIYLYANDPADTVFVAFESWDLGIVATACTDGPQSLVLPLPDARLTLVAQVGESLSQNACNDVIEESPVIDRAWTASAGTLTLDVSPRPDITCDDEWDRYSDAVLTLDNVTFTPDDGGEGAVTVESFSISAGVGWLPG
jgi:hypothetical protein